MTLPERPPMASITGSHATRGARAGAWRGCSRSRRARTSWASRPTWRSTRSRWTIGVRTRAAVQDQEGHERAGHRGQRGVQRGRGGRSECVRERLFKIKKGTNELGIEANVAFNAVEVDDRSAYESDCVKITELAEGCKVTNVCEDIRSAELRVEGKSVGESCTSGGIYTLQLKPGDDHAQTLPDSTLCAVVADESAGPFDPTRHYSDVTQQFKDAGYDWIECAMTNSFPGDAGDLCICCGYSCACIPANAGAAALDRFFCDADACATQSGGKIEEKLFPY